MRPNQRRSLFWLAIIVLMVGTLTWVQYESAKRHEKELAASSRKLRNVYIITASGLQPSHLSSYLYQHIQTPAIDFFAADGVRFTNAFSTSPESLSAHLSLLTGLYPFRKSMKDTLDYAYDLTSNQFTNFVSLPQWFHNQGYHTTAFLADPELRQPSFFLNLFDEVFTGDTVQPFWEKGYSGYMIYGMARDWVQAHQSEPQFLVLNFGEPARPFQPPSPYDRHYEAHPYDGEIAGLDEQIGLFLNLLKTSGLYEQSIVLLTAPYGENVDGVTHQGSLSDDTLHIPLIIAAPGLLPNHQIYETQVSLVDIFPTILRLMGKKPVEGLDGIPLFQKGSDEQFGHEVIFGETRFAHLFRMPSVYFARSEKYKLISGEQNEIFHNFPPDSSTDSLEAQNAEKSLIAKMKQAGVKVLPPTVKTPDVDLSSLLELSTVQARRGYPILAMDLLQSFEDQLVSTPFFQKRLGELAMLAGDTESAIEHFKTAYHACAHPEVLFDLIQARIQSQQFADASDLLRKYFSLVRLPSYYDNSISGSISIGLGEDEKGLQSFNRSLLQNPRFIEAYLKRAQAFAKLKETGRAVSDYRQAIQYAPRDEVAYKELAVLLVGDSKQKDAIPYLRKLLELKPKDYITMLQLAQIEAGLGNLDEAKKLSEEVLLHSDEDDLKAGAKAIIAQ
ncbi:MAG: hypothetical protein C5B54_09535 [Acidobacteria bacterium]|nr:MAG: hypothetical protein C5B54_09535 [Acidobacteriota bacterium]